MAGMDANKMRAKLMPEDSAVWAALDEQLLEAAKGRRNYIFGRVHSIRAWPFADSAIVLSPSEYYVVEDERQLEAKG